MVLGGVLDKINQYVWNVLAARMKMTEKEKKKKVGVGIFCCFFFFVFLPCSVGGGVAM